MSKRVGRSIVMLIVVCTTRAAMGALTLAGMFSDHAVFQADMPVPVWGHATPGTTVTVSFADKSATATADEKGAWRAILPAMPANAKPAKMTVSASGEESKTIDDILVGEVWLGSGQSNMALTVAKADKSEEFIRGAADPQTRLFQVARSPATAPADDVKGKWVICSPETVGPFSAVLYQFGRNVREGLHVPVGLIHSSWGGTPIQTWMPADTLGPAPATQVNPAGKPAPHLQASHLFNGMIAPIIPYAIRGVVWYQGENNVHQHDVPEYAGNMTRMVEAWRSRWHQGEFPFLFVQLPPFGNYRSTREALAEMWEQQTHALKTIHNSGMAPTADLGDLANIHPTNKHEVGRRLALIAFARIYGKPDTVFEGPMYKSHEIEGSAIRVHFTGVGSGLKSRDDKPLTNFEVAGADGAFVPADAKIDGNDVVVSSPKVEKPVALRFAWDESAQPNLANKEGLPAVAFRIPTP